MESFNSSKNKETKEQKMQEKSMWKNAEASRQRYNTYL